MTQRRFMVYRVVRGDGHDAADLHHDRMIARGEDPSTCPHLEASRRAGWVYRPPVVE